MIWVMKDRRLLHERLGGHCVPGLQTGGVVANTEQRHFRPPVGGRRLRLLLASSSVAALILLGSGAPPAFAQNCQIIKNSGAAPSGLSNSSPHGNCILIENGAVVSGNVSNFFWCPDDQRRAGSPSQTIITINNSAVTGSDCPERRHHQSASRNWHPDNQQCERLRAASAIPA